MDKTKNTRHGTLSPNHPMLGRAHDTLPFPVFRNVVEYMGLLPKIQSRATKSFSDHFQKYYCRRCGEYITARRSLRKSRLGPFHISCRERWYTPPQKRLQHYHIADVSLSQLVNERPRHWFHHQIRCPVLFYSREPRNYYRFRVPRIMYGSTPKRLQGLEELFMPLQAVRFEHVVNQSALDVRHNPHFSIIPDMFLSELKLFMTYPALLERRLEMILTQTTKPEFIERYHPSTRQGVFEWMVYLKPDVFRWIEPRIYHRVRRYVDLSSPYVQEVVIHYIGIRRVMLHHREWFQSILMKSPEMLDLLTERDIRRFFRKNRAWFCDYVRQQPKALDYVTLVYPREDEDEEYQDDGSYDDV